MTAITDAQWERALVIIGQVAQKQGFGTTPQRLNDSPGDHDEAFHSVGDDGRITLGTAKHTVLGLDVGCHLTAAAKARGHL
ncbi:LppA family lipoprotein [Kutzneria buriramensis]|uniref:Putative LppA-like lipoprotein n=1 Tax=Kutzneria buriramensis TaxID=1045776 RepID=A0A3E0HM55_9PSEU|nr:LppA family lipoprotein [Kutzneria buriramensis]REH47115.1 putative LppA-like lipoprotein [Kutzneria buriramensis]